MAGSLIVAFAGLLLSAQPDAVARGRRIFHDPGLGRNGVSCATCHAVSESDQADGDGLIRPGHSLWGVAERPHWRGDVRRTGYPSLAKAIDVCVQLFQSGPPLPPDDAHRVVAYLSSLSSRRGQPPLELQPALEANRNYDRPKYRGGDPDRGRALFYRACNACHPRAGAGLGPAIAGKPVPDVAARVREGNGLLRGTREAGAWMPFFGRDRLTDEAVADIASFVATAESHK